MIVLLGLILVTLFRGSKSFKTLIDIERCGPVDWTILTAFIILACTISFFAVRLISMQSELKFKYNRHVCKSDIKYTRGMKIKLVSLGFFSGILASALGLGGGVMYNPIFLSLGVAPKVAAATGMHLIRYSTLSASIGYLVFGTLDLRYGAFLAVLTVIGAILGIVFVNRLVKKLGRQSPIVMILCFVLLFCAVLIPSYGLTTLMDDVNDGHAELWAMGDIC